MGNFTGRNCPDCDVAKGEIHEDGCDVERCEACGLQSLSCGCSDEDRKPYSRQPWMEIWPGCAECREYQFWCYWGPPWLRCSADHPEATPDLNRLVIECVWNPTQGKWVQR